MKFCGKCGTKLEDSAKFCPKCGEVSEDLSQLAPEPVPVKKKSKKLPILAVIALLLVVVVVVTLLIPKKETVYLMTSREIFQVNDYADLGRVDSRSHWSWEYDEDGRILQYTSNSEYDHENIIGPDLSITYSYDANHQLYEVDLRKWDDDLTIMYDYQNGKLQSGFGTGDGESVWVEFECDDDGRPVRRAGYGYDILECSYYANGSVKKCVMSSGPYTYTYDMNEEGLWTAYECFFDGGEYAESGVKTRQVCEYDDYGNIVYQATYTWGELTEEIRISYTYKGGEVKEFTLRDLTGTAHGSVSGTNTMKTFTLTGSSDVYGDYEISRMYDAHGNVLEQMQYQNGELIFKGTYTYEAFEVPEDYIRFSVYNPMYLVD